MTFGDEAEHSAAVGNPIRPTRGKEEAPRPLLLVSLLRLQIENLVNLPYWHSE